MIEAFTFGEPVPVLDQRDLSSYFHAAWNGRWYEPPISLDGLARMLGSNPHHQSAINVKAAILASCFQPSAWLDRARFKRLALDFLVFGNAYCELRRNRLGQPWRLEPTLARYTRVGRDGQTLMLVDGAEVWFEAGTVHHLLEPDVSQEIYGMPGYGGAIQSALLNEAATLFRRKYYVNGSHAGFILYLTDPMQNQEDVDGLREALRQAKGPGNFRNLFLYSPGGKADGVKVIPVAEVAAKDEFMSMKNVTRDDVLVAHRVPPQLMGILPANVGGFGAVDKAARVFARNELRPLMATFLDLNLWMGVAAIAFDPYVIDAAENA
ncbi:MAG: phage portal protein [Alphaproteobacteria bacterium]|nr:phage portal protein [Alphaproteobacteria bacterium]